MNLSLLYLLPIFTVFVCLFLFFSGQIIFTQTIDQKVSSLENLLKEPNPSYEDFFRLGQLYLQKKDYNEAIKQFYLSLRIWNKNDKVGLACLYNTLGVTYFNIKEYKLAVYYYTQAINLFPNYLKVLNNLAFLYEETKQKINARSIYKQIWMLDKTNKTARVKFQALNRI